MFLAELIQQIQKKIFKCKSTQMKPTMLEWEHGGDAMKTKGQMIASIRKQKGLTQQQLSDLTKIPIGSIKQYETDKRNPKFETVKAIADALEINVFDLTQDVESIRKDAESFDSLPEYDLDDIETFRNFLSLNSDGKQKVSEYIDDLIQSHKYEE